MATPKTVPQTSKSDYEWMLGRIGELLEMPKELPEVAELAVLTARARNYERLHSSLSDPVAAYTPIPSMFDGPIIYNENMTFSEIIRNALEKDDLVEAIATTVLWEHERARRERHRSKDSDSCFFYLIEEVFSAWKEKFGTEFIFPKNR